MMEIMQNEFFHIEEEESVKGLKVQENSKEQMKAVNYLNWQYFNKENKIQEGKDRLSKDKALPDFESIQIGQDIELINLDPTVCKLMELPSVNLVINLYSCVLINKNQQIKSIRKASLHEQENRFRPESVHKSDGKTINYYATQGNESSEDDSGAFAKERGAFGKQWTIRCKKCDVLDDQVMPTFDEMMNGIANWYFEQM